MPPGLLTHGETGWKPNSRGAKPCAYQLHKSLRKLDAAEGLSFHAEQPVPVVSEKTSIWREPIGTSQPLALARHEFGLDGQVRKMS